MKELKIRAWALLAFIVILLFAITGLERRLSRAERQIVVLQRENEKVADVFDQVESMFNNQATLNDFFMSHCEKTGI